jgi:hypothetical protein
MAITGRASNTPPPDLIIAAMTSFTALLTLSFVAPLLLIVCHSPRIVTRVCIVIAAVWLVATPLLITASLASNNGVPYTPEHPKRLVVEHVHQYASNHSHVAIVPADALPAPAVRAFDRDTQQLLQSHSDYCVDSDSYQHHHHQQQQQQWCATNIHGEPLPSYVPCATVPTRKLEHSRAAGDVQIITIAHGATHYSLSYNLTRTGSNRWLMQVDASDAWSCVSQWQVLDSASTVAMTSAQPLHHPPPDAKWLSLLPPDSDAAAFNATCAYQTPSSTAAVAATPTNKPRIRARFHVGYNPIRTHVMRFEVAACNATTSLPYLHFWATYAPSPVATSVLEALPAWCTAVGVSIVRGTCVL